MERAFILDKFNTYIDWKLILEHKEITYPEPKTNYVELDGASGSLDLTESLTGEVAYKDRTITAQFLTDYGDRKTRDNLIREITRALHGKKVEIIEPDDLEHYYLGRFKMGKPINTLSYAQFTLEATCEPWRYAINESVRRIDVNSQEITSLVINNNGRKTLSPNIKVEGNVNIIIDGVVSSLSDGEYKISNLKLKEGSNIITVSGFGSLIFTYREADL